MVQEPGVPVAVRLGRRGVVRPRLLSRFDRVAETGVLLVSAGAGYGKTAALSSWVSGLEGAALAWVSCREEHDDPHRLAAVVASELRASISDVPVETLGELAAALGPAEALMVFDDAHRLRNPSVWRSLADLLERRPDNLRVVVSARDEEGLPWHLLRARGEVTEVHGEDLCFTPQEAAGLLSQTYGVDDADHVAADLVDATNGWAVGLCLAGHALRHGSNDVLDRTALGGHRFIRGYFDDELLAGLEQEQVEFLEVTSVLERLDPELCDLITGRADSHAMLEGFVEHNLFTSQVSMAPPVFRYHELFMEYLRTRPGRRGTHTTAEALALASRWYEEHELADLAIESAVRSGDNPRVEELIREASGPTLRAGFPHTVVRWLSVLPQESLDSNPDLALLLARAAGATGDLLAAHSGLAAVDACLRAARTPPPAPLRLAHATLAFVLKLWEMDLDSAATELDRAEAIAAGDCDAQGHDMFGLDPSDLGAYRAMIQLLSGDLDGAIARVERILTPGQLLHPGKDAVLAVGVRALAMAWSDDPQTARQAVEQCRGAAVDFRGRTGGLLALLVAGSWCAEIDLARSDLESARTIVDDVGLPVYRAVYSLAEARVGIRAGDRRAASASLDRAHDILTAVPSAGFLDVIEDGLRAELTALASCALETPFTDREVLVLREIAAGASRREAAAHLYLSVNTVKTYLRSAYRKLSATNREEAIGRAQELGLLDPSNS